MAEAVQADLVREEQDKEVAATTEAWLVGLRENLDAVEADADEAFAKRRELVKLLVERMVARRGEDGGLKVDITYCFGPPGEAEGEDTGLCMSGEQKSTEFCTPSTLAVPTLTFTVVAVK